MNATLLGFIAGIALGFAAAFAGFDAFVPSEVEFRLSNRKSARAV
jgi:hypothetical protein